MTLGLTQVEVGALRQCVSTIGDVEHVVDHLLIVAVTVFEHTHGVSSGAERLTLGVIEVTPQIGACLSVIAQMVVTLTDKAVELGIKVVVLPHLEQRLALIDDIIKTLVVIGNLGEVILGLEAQLAGLRDGTKLRLSSIVVATGIVQIGLVEVAGTAIAWALFQLIIQALGLAVIRHAQVAISAAVH